MKLIADGLTSTRGGRTLFSRACRFAVDGGEALLLTGAERGGQDHAYPHARRAARAGGRHGPRSMAASLSASEASSATSLGTSTASRRSLTVEENPRFWADFSAAAGSGAKIDGALSAFGLAHLADIPAGYLSAGQKRRLALARLLAGASVPSGCSTSRPCRSIPPRQDCSSRPSTHTSRPAASW